MSRDYSKIKEIIDKSKNICVFTGAGISCPSGIPDFRSSNGVFNEKTKCKYTPEMLVSHSAFVSETELFYSFYKDKMLFPDAKPNIAHLYFAKLEKQGKNVSVVTQNIDGLHSAAGNSKVYEIHGSVHRNYCTKCGKFFNLQYICDSQNIPVCDDCGSIIKPDVVLYEEQLNETVVQGAVRAISSADTLIIVGTSLIVYPAASFINYFSGDNVIVINKSEINTGMHGVITVNDDIVNVIEYLENN